jgi:hypothetical protein
MRPAGALKRNPTWPDDSSDAAGGGDGTNFISHAPDDGDENR